MVDYEDVHLVRQGQGLEKIDSMKPGDKLDMGKKRELTSDSQGL